MPRTSYIEIDTHARLAYLCFLHNKQQCGYICTLKLYRFSEMTKVKVITSLEASEKVVKELLCLDVGVVGVNCKGSDVGPKGNLMFVYTDKNNRMLY
jgi:hypothetical protein